MKNKWNISFDNGFFNNNSTKRGGTEVRTNKQFLWGDNNVYIPAIYLCSKGLVADILIEKNTDDVWNFIEKYNLIKDEFGHALSKDERDNLNRENPLGFSFNASITVNQKLTRQTSGSCCVWLPRMPEDFEPSDKSREVLEHYGMDLEKAWCIHRVSFEWATVRKPTIKSISITLTANNVNFPAEHFTDPQNGDIYTITNPINGKEHTVTVIETEKKTVNDLHFLRFEEGHPRNFTVMTYTVEPNPGLGKFRIEDNSDSENPRLSNKANTDISDTSASSIGIIGGADGPTVISYASGPQKRVATSSMYHEKEHSIEWRTVFCQKPLDDITEKLI